MYKILIVEDDSTISQMYRMKFEAEPDFEVRVATDGLEGVRLAESIEPDLILLDIQMPTMHGDEALKAIRHGKWHGGKNVPVIVLTNLGEEEAPESLRSLGISSYIVKADLTPRQVVSRVKETLDI